jgi:hypothetical protein
MHFAKNVKLIAVLAVILVLFAGLSSCEQAATGSAPEAETRQMAGNIPVDRLGLIGKAPARSLSGLSQITGSPELSYDFPEFLEGIWDAENNYGDSFHLEDPDEIGYSLFGWPPFIGWEGSFEAVYYFDGTDPEERGLVFANFEALHEWAVVPPGTEDTISAFYYQKAPKEDEEDPDAYYLLNLAMEGHDPNFPSFYEYGQPMYPTVAAALADLLQPGVLDEMLIIWIGYIKQ